MSLALIQLKVVCGSVQLHLQFGSENAKSPVHELFTPIKISQLFFVKLFIQKIPESIYIYTVYPPENKPPPLFDLQVLAQVCLPRL